MQDRDNNNNFTGQILSMPSAVTDQNSDQKERRERRILDELQNCGRPDLSEFKVDIADVQLDVWKAVIRGKPFTDWIDVTLKIKIKFPEGYPAVSPMIVLEPRLFHPNVDDDGQIYLTSMNEGWNQTKTMKDVLESVRQALSEPDK